jgi:hypothetical protein
MEGMNSLFNHSSIIGFVADDRTGYLHYKDQARYC